LLKLLNDILDLSRIEANKFAVEPVVFDFRKVIENIVHLFSGSIEIKGLSFHCQIEEAIPDNLIGDPIRLGQVLSNVLSNAQKFTEEGEIILEVKQQSNSEETVNLEFIVQDTGIGISRENLPLIFESFSQVDGSTTRKYGGAGLGLTITKNIVEMMGGQINIESGEGQGTSIQFTLTFEKAKEGRVFLGLGPDIKSDRALMLDDFKVLVVDDDRLSRIVCKEMFGK